ncbi:hypothetical protein [Fodinicola acaciae]|uniref:hypothetical protein n=1 Tax=Fodinicola acaciae TaxID=2681555 RepID=UPI0013D4FDB6|nr:hypothetical protein [Fodinicola acaciae]
MPPVSRQGLFFFVSVAGCSVSSPRPSNRACGSPAHGSPTPFTAGIRRCPPVPEGSGCDNSSIKTDQPKVVTSLGTTWQLGNAPCPRCALDMRARTLLGDQNGVISSGLNPLHDALMGVERPDTANNWLARPKVAGLLTALRHDHRPLDHQVLDELPAGKTLAHLRSILVATGALPPRDERLVAVERWIAATIQSPDDIGEDGLAIDPTVYGVDLWCGSPNAVPPPTGQSFWSAVPCGTRSCRFSSMARR